MPGIRFERSAISALFDEHFDEIFRYAARRVGHDAALDVAAETFAQVLRHPERIDPERDARGWLFGVATNVLRHHARGESRRLNAYARAAAEPRSSSDEIRSIMRGELVQALGDLDRRDRDALLLLVWGDLSYAQIAEALDVPVGTVRSRIHRARGRLRAALSVDGESVAIQEVR